MSELDLTFRATFSLTAEGRDPNEGSNEPLTLAQVIEACKAEQVGAVLRDEAGFQRGAVTADGNWRLS